MNKIRIIQSSWVILSLLILSPCYADEIKFSCDANYKQLLGENVISEKSVKFELLIEENGTQKEASIANNAAFLTDGLPLKFTDGSCISAAFPVCATTIQIDAEKVRISKNKHAKWAMKDNQFFDVHTTEILIDRRNGALEWKWVTSGNNSAVDALSMMTTNIKGRCFVDGKNR